jgi:hypothetical protein
MARNVIAETLCHFLLDTELCRRKPLQGKLMDELGPDAPEINGPFLYVDTPMQLS